MPTTLSRPESKYAIVLLKALKGQVDGDIKIVDDFALVKMIELSRKKCYAINGKLSRMSLLYKNQI